MKNVQEGQVGFLCIDGTHADVVNIAAAKFKHGNLEIYRTSSPRIFFMDTSGCSKSPEQIVESILNKRNPIHGGLSLIPVDYTSTARAKDMINAAKRSLQNNEVLKDAVQFTFLPCFHDFNRHKMPGDHLSVSLKGAVDIVYPKAFLLRRNFFSIIISIAVGDIYTIGIVNKISSPKTMESIIRHMEQNFEEFEPLVRENINEEKLRNQDNLNHDAKEKWEIEDICERRVDKRNDVQKDCKPQTSIFFASTENGLENRVDLGAPDDHIIISSVGTTTTTDDQKIELTTEPRVANIGNDIANEGKKFEMKHLETLEVITVKNIPKPENLSTSAESRQLLSEENARNIFCPCCKTEIVEIAIMK